VPFLQLLRVSREHHTDFFLLKVQRDAENAMRKSEHLAAMTFSGMHARNTVAHADEPADFID